MTWPWQDARVLVGLAHTDDEPVIDIVRRPGKNSLRITPSFLSAPAAVRNALLGGSRPWFGHEPDDIRYYLSATRVRRLSGVDITVKYFLDGEEVDSVTAYAAHQAKFHVDSRGQVQASMDHPVCERMRAAIQRALDEEPA